MRKEAGMVMTPQKERGPVAVLRKGDLILWGGVTPLQEEIQPVVLPAAAIQGVPTEVPARGNREMQGVSSPAGRADRAMAAVHVAVVNGPAGSPAIPFL